MAGLQGLPRSGKLAEGPGFLAVQFHRVPVSKGADYRFVVTGGSTLEAQLSQLTDAEECIAAPVEDVAADEDNWRTQDERDKIAEGEACKLLTSFRTG